MEFKHYPAERLKTASVHSRLKPEEKQVRFALMGFTIDRKRPYNYKLDDPKELLTSMAPCQVTSCIEQMIAKHAIVAGSNGDINFMYPVSALPTGHKVTLADGRTFSAMCAVDAMGTAFTFNQDVVVNSACCVTKTPIEVVIKGGKLDHVTPAAAHVLHVDLTNNLDWSGSC